ncbi:hypothetical protein QLX08_007849 [Tetragonisca angustula]|uniref:Uncharacterized protein n=1 Tax=Tetragonisca angustula TaxID=166442 RepID=A0AAW0ZN05_9HYME
MRGKPIPFIVIKDKCREDHRAFVSGVKPPSDGARKRSWFSNQCAEPSFLRIPSRYESKGTGKEDQGKRERRFHEIAWVILFPCHSTPPGIITRRHVAPPARISPPFLA